MSEIIMLNGVSHSGKSTWVEKNILSKGLFDNRFDILNFDKLAEFPIYANFDDISLIKVFIDAIVSPVHYKVRDMYIKQNNQMVRYFGEKYFILSADSIRNALHNVGYYDAFEPIVWSVRNYILDFLILNKYNIVIDETNTKKDRRLAVFNKIKELNADYNVDCICFEFTYVDEIINRADSKYHELIYKQFKDNEPPELSEGFNDIIKVK